MLSSSFLLFLFDYLHQKVPETFRFEKYAWQNIRDCHRSFLLHRIKKLRIYHVFTSYIRSLSFLFYQITRLTATMER